MLTASSDACVAYVQDGPTILLFACDAEYTHPSLVKLGPQHNTALIQNMQNKVCEFVSTAAYFPRAFLMLARLARARPSGWSKPAVDCA